jgi:hypothetical protein
LEAAGNTLKITGPKEAEPLVRLLAKSKAQVLELLADSGLQELRELRKITTESPQQDLPLSVEEEARRDRFEQRAAVLEFDEGLPRAEAEAIAHQETAAAVYDDMETLRTAAGPYSSALTALRAQCPDYVPEDRWQQAIADATTFISEWCAEAQAFGWTVQEPIRPTPGAGATTGELLAIGASRRHGASLVVARSPSSRLDSSGGGVSLPKRGYPEVLQARQVGTSGGNRQEDGVSNRPARITQAEIERAIRAAKKAGLPVLEVKIGDEVAIRIPLITDQPVAKTEEVVL